MAFVMEYVVCIFRQERTVKLLQKRLFPSGYSAIEVLFHQLFKIIFCHRSHITIISTKNRSQRTLENAVLMII